MLKLPGHIRYDYSPIVKRPDYSWPERQAARLLHRAQHRALCVRRRHRHGSGQRSGQQTPRNFAWRDYGNRIGNWRLFEILDELKLPATILLNSSVCYNYPEIVEKIKARGDDVLGHGRTNAETCCGRCGSTTRRAPSQECTEVIEKHVGVRPTGWMGPGALESNVTPDLLKEAGYTHLLDWPVDDQPIWMQTRSGPLLSVPYPMELNDAGTLVHRDHTGREFARHDRRPVRGDAASSPSASRWCSRWRCTASSSASRSGCGRCGRRSSIASSTSRRTGSGSRAPARSRSTASRCPKASYPAVEWTLVGADLKERRRHSNVDGADGRSGAGASDRRIWAVRR